MQSFTEYFEALQIDESDSKYNLISNFSKFQMARNTGQIKPDFMEYLRFFKYEYTTRARPAILNRLFTLTWGLYTQAVRQEYFDA